MQHMHNYHNKFKGSAFSVHFLNIWLLSKIKKNFNEYCHKCNSSYTAKTGFINHLGPKSQLWF